MRAVCPCAGCLSVCLCTDGQVCPLQCINREARAANFSSSLSLPDKTLQFVKDHPLMDGSVTPIDNRPRLIKTYVNYTQIVVDRTQALDGTFYDVMFISTGGSRPLARTPANPAHLRRGSQHLPRAPGGVSGRVSEKPPPLAGLRRLPVRPLGRWLNVQVQAPVWGFRPGARGVGAVGAGGEQAAGKSHVSAGSMVPDLLWEPWDFHTSVSGSGGGAGRVRSRKAPGSALGAFQRALSTPPARGPRRTAPRKGTGAREPPLL